MAEETGQGASQVQGTSTGLSKQSEQLRAEVGKFLATIRGEDQDIGDPENDEDVNDEEAAA